MSSEYVALDITTNEVRVISINGDVITKWRSVPLPEGAIKAGTIVDPGPVSLIIDDLFRSLNLNRDKVACTLTGLPFIYRTITMPGGNVKIASEAIEREARKEMSISNEDMYLVWQEIENQRASQDRDYFVMGVPRRPLNLFLDVLDQAKIKRYFVGVKPLALARAASTGDALVVSMESNYFDVVIVSEGTVRVIHSVTPASQADNLPGNIDELADGLSRAVKSFNRDFPQNNIAPEAPILLSGQLSSAKEILQLITEATGHPASIVNPVFKGPDDMPFGLYAANMGLVLKKTSSQYRDINLNLLQAVAKPNQRRFKMSYAVVAGVVIVLAFLVYESYNLKSNADARIASLQQREVTISKQIANAQTVNTEALASQKTANDKYQGFAGDLAAYRADNTQINGKKVDYANYLTMVIGAAPQNSELHSIDLQPGNITIQGVVTEPYEVLAYTGSLESSGFPSATVRQLEPSHDSGSGNLDAAGNIIPDRVSFQISITD
jgi:Tfp pilus assembly PilM family ATPase